mmetsp:Transcript_20168/g.26644  ORF Transcript_20168/g.26644 Transcript_20168/m.26644 type:complete len:259 (+) Transcript_20168:1097-1873(+)
MGVCLAGVFGIVAELDADIHIAGLRVRITIWDVLRLPDDDTHLIFMIDRWGNLNRWVLASCFTVKDVEPASYETLPTGCIGGPECTPFNGAQTLPFPPDLAEPSVFKINDGCTNDFIHHQVLVPNLNFELTGTRKCCREIISVEEVGGKGVVLSLGSIAHYCVSQNHLAVWVGGIVIHVFGHKPLALEHVKVHLQSDPFLQLLDEFHCVAFVFVQNANEPFENAPLFASAFFSKACCANIEGESFERAHGIELFFPRS